jgi:hypothetical protein
MNLIGTPRPPKANTLARDVLNTLIHHRESLLTARQIADLAWPPSARAHLRHPERSAKNEVRRLRALGWPIITKIGRGGGHQLARS